MGLKLNSTPLKLLLGLSLVSSHAWSETPAPVNFVPIDKWSYQPIDDVFWTQTQFDLKNSNLTRMQDLTHQQIKKQSNSIKGAEALMALVNLCQTFDLQICQLTLSLKVLNLFPGSEASYLALQTLEDLHQRLDWIHLKAYEIVSGGNFQQAPANLLPYLNYLAKNKIVSPSGNNYWDQLLNLEQKMQSLHSTPVKNLIAELQATQQNSDTHPKIKQKVTLQLARLHFENFDYNKALTLYDSVTSLPHEEHQILYEKAWTYFWLNRYSETLGNLHTLRAPLYQLYLYPDTYLLEILSLRALCQHQMAKNAARRFDIQFKSTLNHIKSNQRLDQNFQLAQVISTDRSLNIYIQLIQKLKLESDSLQANPKLTKQSLTFLKKLYQDTEAQFLKELKILYHPSLNFHAREFIDLNEQIKLLDYLIGLDQNLVSKKMASNTVKMDTEPKVTFQLLHWPFESEYWIDEISHYQVFVQDQCGDFNL